MADKGGKSGFIAVFTNDNGNCSVCGVVFVGMVQAQEWAEASLKSDGATNIKRTETEVTAEMGGGLFGQSEVRFTIHPMSLADAGVPGGALEVADLHTIR